MGLLANDVHKKCTSLIQKFFVTKFHKFGSHKWISQKMTPSEILTKIAKIA